MERIHKTFEIGVPVRTAYYQWTQFEDSPRFMDGAREVRQIDDTHPHWRASLAGRAQHLRRAERRRGALRAAQPRAHPRVARDGVRAAERHREAGDALGIVSRKLERKIQRKGE